MCSSCTRWLQTFRRIVSPSSSRVVTSWSNYYWRWGLLDRSKHRRSHSPSHTASHLHKTWAHVVPAVRTAKLAAFSDGYIVSRGYTVLSSFRLQCLVTIKFCPAYGYSVSRGFTVLSSLQLQCVSWLYSTVQLTVTVCLVAIQYCPAYGHSVSRGYTVLASLRSQCVSWLYSTVQLTITVCLVAIQYCPA